MSVDIAKLPSKNLNLTYPPTEMRHFLIPNSKASR